MNEFVVHTYDPDSAGRCQGGWYNEQGKWIYCHSTQRSSVLHDDPEADFREMHDHGGGDCVLRRRTPRLLWGYGRLREVEEIGCPR